MAAPVASASELFSAHLPLIERVVAAVCRRQCCGRDEAEEFASTVMLKFCEDDHAVLRRFKNESSLETYLTAVVVNAFKDFRNRQWGKWRPSAVAKRLGKVAVRLEQLTARDGYSFEEACELLRTNHQVDLPREELVQLWQRLPPRVPRQIEGIEQAENRAAEGISPEEHAVARELESTRLRVEAALAAALAGLSADDRLIITLEMEENLTVADIARALCLPQKPLYRRRERILGSLRSSLERDGLRWEQVGDLLRHGDFVWQGAGDPPPARRTESERRLRR
jgi:RNA polymerase sigma factor (sigma-70 family)